MAKEINLPIPQVCSISFDMRKVSPSQFVEYEGKKAIFMGTIDFAERKIESEVIRKNGSQILYATTGVEKQLEDLILAYFFGPFKQRDERRDFFMNYVLQSTSIEFSYKKELAIKIIEKSSLLTGNKRNNLQTNLKKIMLWRNIFAHGRLEHDTLAGSIIRYFSGSPQVLVLDDEYWTTVEEIYKNTAELLTESIKNSTSAPYNEEIDPLGMIGSDKQ